MSKKSEAKTGKVNKINTVKMEDQEVETEVEEEVVEEEVKEEVLTISPLTVKAVKPQDELVEVNISCNVSIYIGDRYWHFIKGLMKVPMHIKRELARRNLLTAI
jgi:hypothetical protein